MEFNSITIRPNIVIIFRNILYDIFRQDFQIKYFVNNVCCIRNNNDINDNSNNNNYDDNSNTKNDNHKYNVNDDDNNNNNENNANYDHK